MAPGAGVSGGRGVGRIGYRHGWALLSGFPWEVPAYDQWNLRAGVQGDRFSVTAYVENLTDDHHFTNAYEKVFLGGVQVEPAYRTYGVRLTYRMH